ncbi:RNA recognition motif domain-containing protein [Ditylenchus destructor]|uniref:RNA recognition motif domain-containing protein n=1 Tax=Ditylenchus destructor TaxID=166010 RepID=A0AAD4NCP0_9BILA|nr:RNA recognition motif domain-containing protein [Ditylenchus destructor]
MTNCGFQNKKHNGSCLEMYDPSFHCELARSFGFKLRSIDDQPRTIYIANLAPEVSKDVLKALFGPIGSIEKIEIMSTGAPNKFAFVEFVDHSAAAQAIRKMNMRVLLDQMINVNWLTELSPPEQNISPNDGYFHVFVGNLSPDVDNQTLRAAFSFFGYVSEVRVIREPTTANSKGYGFVTYPSRQSAELAIAYMNGQHIGQRAIRTNWGNPKRQFCKPESHVENAENHITFESEYDLETANARFREMVLDSSDGDLKRSNSSTAGPKYENSQKAAANFYNKDDSFYDCISCQSLEKMNGKKFHPDLEHENQINQQTFGCPTNPEDGSKNYESNSRSYPSAQFMNPFMLPFAFPHHYGFSNHHNRASMMNGREKNGRRKQ